MNQTPSGTARSLITIRWTARIIGILSMAVFLVFFVADCVHKGRIPVESDRIFMTVFLLLVFIGLSIAWKWEGIGGATALAGLIGYNIVAPTTVASAGTLAVTALYGVPALLFLYCWFRSGKTISPKAT